MLGSRLLSFNVDGKSTLSFQDKAAHKLNVLTSTQGVLDSDLDLNNRFVYNNDLFVSNPIQTVESQIKPRKISSNPYRILDAPGLCDDFYLNLVDWSS